MIQPPRGTSLLLLALLMVASAVVSAGLSRHARAELRERQAILQGTNVEVEQLRGENDRLAVLVSVEEIGRTVTTAEERQLLALRSEVGQLRKVLPEKERLQAANLKLQAAASTLSNQLSQAQALPNYWPKEQLTFAGSTDPESAMRSLLWAMHTANLGQLKESFSPEAIAKLLDEWQRRGVSDDRRKNEVEIMAQALTGPSVGFHVVEEKSTSTNRAVLTLSFDGEGKTRKFVLRRIGNEWKVESLVFAGQPEPDENH